MRGPTCRLPHVQSNAAHDPQVREQALALRAMVNESVQVIGKDRAPHDGPLSWEGCLKKFSMINHQVRSMTARPAVFSDPL